MKTRSTTLILCFFFGGLGIHMFYLNKNFEGLIRLVFFWTFLPALLALFELFQFTFMSDETFDKRYNTSLPRSVSNAADDLAKLAALVEKKLLTEYEYNEKKVTLLKRIG